MDTVEAAVIGAGVVGLAVARSLAQSGREVVILEAEGQIGAGISSRNSEVIHAGIYYPTGSLKARLCVAGRAALYRYCAERGIPHRRCGKLIVATDAAEAAALRGIAASALANGVDDLREITAAEAQALEPALFCTAALLSPSTGILDSHALMLSLLGEAEAAGAMLALATPVTGLAPHPSGVVVTTAGAAPMQLLARQLVNAAGHGAPALGHALTDTAPQGFLAKGNYFALTGAAPFSRLIYPVPVPGGLGVHLTLDLQGRAKFGPDVEWVARADHTVDPARADGFAAAIRRYWPGLDVRRLLPDYAGIRPKIVGPGEAAADFRIDGPRQHGLPGFVGLYGIESPGLTSALAIGATVRDILNAECRAGTTR
ncbi:MAG: NAD(P)/FAD-dependent oxidoreductase [Pseudomonadota bacterium]